MMAACALTPSPPQDQPSVTSSPRSCAASRCVRHPLDRLHLTTQSAHGLTNSHLYELRAGDVGLSTPDLHADRVDDFLESSRFPDLRVPRSHRIS